MEKRVTVKMPENEHKAVRLKAVELGVTVSDVVRDLLARWLAGEIEVKPGK